MLGPYLKTQEIRHILGISGLRFYQLLDRTKLEPDLVVGNVRLYSPEAAAKLAQMKNLKRRVRTGKPQN